MNLKMCHLSVLMKDFFTQIINMNGVKFKVSMHIVIFYFNAKKKH